MSDFKAKMHQLFVGWGSAPDHAGELRALPRPIGSGGKDRRGEGKGKRKVITCIDNLKSWQPFGSECDLKMHVQNLGIPAHTTCYLTATLTAYIFGSKHDIHNRASASQTTSGLLHRIKMTWTLVHKRLKIGPEFLFMLDKFWILFYCQALQTDWQRSANRTQPDFARRWTVNPANNLPLKSRVVLPPKNWGPKTFRFFQFSTTSRLNGK